MANNIESRVTLEDEVFEETIDTAEEPIEVVRPSSYNDLQDLPQINGVTLQGNKTSSDLGIVTQNDINSAVSAEATLRENADTALGGRIDQEITDRGNADTALGGRIDGEITNRTNADNALGTRIDNEILARQGGDNNLQTQIDAITGKSDVVDVVADYAALQSYDTQHLGNNDVIKVLDDETHDDAQTYYRWNKTAGTWSYIGSEAPYYSKGQMDVMLQGKQDKLIAGTNIQIAQDGKTISATDTTYTAGNGLNLNGTEFSADTTVLATKTDLDGYYTKTEADTKLAPKLETEVVTTLPTTGDEGKLYLTPKDYTTGTATGNPITIALGEDEGAIDSFQLDGDTYQQTYTGKNLVGFPTAHLADQDGLTLDFAEDGTITIDGTRGEETITYYNSSTLFNIPAGSFTLTVIPISGSFSGASIGTRAYKNNQPLWYQTYNSAGQYYQGTLTKTAEEIAGMTGIRLLIGSGTAVFNNFKFKLQVTAGSDHDTDYEPFVGGQPSPNPSYPQQIQTVTGTQTISINGTDYPIDLGDIQLCGLGDDGNGNPLYRDYIYPVGEDWKVHKETVSAIIDGSESWDTSGTNTFYVANIYSKIGNIIQPVSTAGEMYASHFTIADITSSNTLVGAILRADAAHNVSNLRIRLQDMSGGTAGFRQMLSAKKPSIYARRLTPTDTTITDTNLIAQLEAVRNATLQASNTITNTATGSNLAGDLELGYYEYDPQNRYDKWLWLRANNAYEEFDEEGGGGGGGSITVDSALSTTSKNPVQNKVVTAAINSKVDSSSLATVATSGSYNDLSNKPTIPTIPTQTSAFTNNGSDGTSTYVEASGLATVATTGAYSDLSGTPTIPTATGDLTNDSGFITSADLPTKTSDLTNDGSDGTSTYVEASGLATVATSGSYNDLSNKPTIPTVNNGTLTIRQNGKTLGEFTANQSTNTTVNLTDNSSYSTSEVKTSATWINGKPIYKKTFSFTLADAESTTINHGISNFGLLIRFEGTAVSSSTKTVPIPRTLTDTNYQVGLEGVTTTSFEIDVGSSGPRGKQAYLTLWYTKTTD